MSENLALVFTDVVDSTALNQRLGDAVMNPLWVEHDRAARDLLRRWRGREIGRGDGFLLLFGNAADAVGFALAYQASLAALQVPLAARVGVHVGPVALRENEPAVVAQGATPFEIDGLSLPVVARVMSAATGGQILLSSQAHAALGPTSLRTLSHGYWRLKGLHDPVELFEVGAAAAPFSPPPDSAKAYRVVNVGDTWTPARALPHNLPAERDAFIGRREVLTSLADHFESGVRLVTLAGPGGIGKTRAAQQHARTWLGECPGGTWFCNLSSARSLDGILHAVAESLDVPLGRVDPVQQIGAAIAGRGSCLLILDNFEQVAEHAAETVGIWLERAPEARFIATSREILGIAGEHVLMVDTLQREEAVQMFRHRVQAVGGKRNFDLDDEQAVIPLMDLLDRLPLAIELAAARTRLMGPRLLLERMSNRFELLAARGGRPDRQATLRATLDWSWGLLSPHERVALAQLSVFEGGFTLEAAEAVVMLSDTRLAPETVNVLQALVEKSLVQERSSMRFDLLGSVQEYAAEQLKHADDGRGRGALVEARMRHAEHFAGLGARATVAALCAELDNLVAAASRAAALGHHGSAVGALEAAWQAFRLRGPYRTLLDIAERVRSMPGLGDASTARIDRVVGWALRACGRVEDSRLRFSAGLRAAQAAGDRRCEGHLRCHLGDLHVNAGRLDEGRLELSQALAMAREADDPALECEACSGLGNLYQRMGRLDETRAQYEAALAAARRAGDRRWEGGSLGNLGVLCANQGKTADAERFYAQALAVARELGDRQWEGNALCNLGLMHYVEGQFGLAADELQASLQSARELGHVRLECVVLCNLGMVVEAMHDPTGARQHYEAALKVARSLGDRRSEGQVLGYLGLLLARAARFDEARACLEQGRLHLLEMSDRLSLALLHCSRAECEHLAGAVTAAEAELAAATLLAVEVGAEPGSELQVSIERVRRMLPRASSPEPAADRGADSASWPRS